MEFPELGSSCSYEGCHQLDFLPFECSHCHEIFCKEHYMPANHSCSSHHDNVKTSQDVSQVPSASASKEKWQYKCSHPDCNIKELIPINCIKCKRHFCLSHRHADQHACVRDKPTRQTLSTESQAAKDFQSKVTEDINAKLEEAKGAGGHKAAMASKIALMKLKARAKGENSVPRDERIFFSIECPNRQQNPVPLDIFLGKSWSMGKAVDFISRQGSIKNKNHLPTGPFLHLFKAGIILSKPLENKIQQLVDGGLLVDGDSLSLQYEIIPEPTEIPN